MLHAPCTDCTALIVWDCLVFQLGEREVIEAWDVAILGAEVRT